MKAVLAILLLAVIPSFLFAQNAKYTPQAPAYKINGEEVLYDGYIINRNGAKVFTTEMYYAGFCFNFKTMLPVINETDSLVMVAFSGHDKFNYDEFFL